MNNTTVFGTDVCSGDVQLVIHLELGHIITHVILLLMALKLYTNDNQPIVVNVTAANPESDDDTETDNNTVPTSCELDDIPCECPGGGRYKFRKTAKRKFCDRHA